MALAKLRSIGCARVAAVGRQRGLDQRCGHGVETVSRGEEGEFGDDLSRQALYPEISVRDLSL